MPTTLADVMLVEHLARTWLRHPHHDAPHGRRPGWQHAEDVVGIVRQMTGIRPNVDTQWYLEAVAWGHHLLEDGLREDGGRVSEQDLREAGVPEHVVLGIVLLTRRAEMTAMGYWRAIDGAPELVQVVEVCCVIAHLRESAQALDDQAWSRSVSRARRYTMAHVQGMGQPWRTWLEARLVEAMSKRATVRIVSTSKRRHR